MDVTKLINSFSHLPIINCSNDEELAFIIRSMPARYVRIRVPTSLVIAERRVTCGDNGASAPIAKRSDGSHRFAISRKVDVIENLDSPEFSWFKFFGETMFLPRYCPNTDLVLKSPPTQSHLICGVCSLDMVRTLSCGPFRCGAMSYFGGTISINLLPERPSTSLWSYFSKQSDIVYIDDWISEYDFIPIFEFEKSEKYIMGTRLRAKLGDVVENVKQCVVESYYGKVKIDGVDTLAYGHNIFYGSDFENVLIDFDPEMQVVFRVIDCVDKSDRWFTPRRSL